MLGLLAPLGSTSTGINPAFILLSLTFLLQAEQRRDAAGNHFIKPPTQNNNNYNKNTHKKRGIEKVYLLRNGVDLGVAAVDCKPHLKSIRRSCSGSQWLL